jgi:hypothetical protein
LDSKSFPNSPANDNWELQLASTSINALEPRFTYITFLPNGSIDKAHTSPSDLEEATRLLAPALSRLQAQLNVTFDLWEMLNWIFVSYYWVFLSDFGQISPVTSDAQTILASTNNIFTNQSLFDIYSSYLRDTVIPLFGSVAAPFLPLPPFSHLSDGNHLQAEDSTFTRSYSCVERQLKPPIAFVLSVIVADYVLIAGGFHFAIFIAGMIQKRKRQDGTL